MKKKKSNSAKRVRAVEIDPESVPDDGIVKEDLDGDIAPEEPIELPGEDEVPPERYDGEVDKKMREYPLTEDEAFRGKSKAVKRVRASKRNKEEAIFKRRIGIYGPSFTKEEIRKAKRNKSKTKK